MEKWFQNKNFSTEKRGQGIKARKGHRGINARKIHRALGILLAAALVFQTVPFEGIAVSASESSGGGLCEHHRSHTPDCGYKEAEPGHACTHEHTEDCYRTVEEEDGSTTRELDCHHVHDESCGYREAAEGSPCTFVCEICKGGTDEIPEDKTDDNEINDGDSENPGTENGDEIEEPGDGQEECICEERCTEDSINTDCPVCGAEDASLSDCKGKDVEDSTEDAEENRDQPEDTGICKHHREHDDACGYLPESEDSESSPCTYECRICPIEELIAALPDKVTEDNAEDVRGQFDEILALYRELTGEEPEQIDLSRCYALQAALAPANAPMMADGRTEQQDTDEASVTIGEETLYYATLEEAFAAANGQTATIIMLTDAECVHSGSNGSPLNITSGNVTLNLNGKALSGMGYGYYGIIDVSGGSLLVQGEKGAVKVARRGLSCRGNGKLIVEGITLNFAGNNVGFAGAGIHNVGGTVTLNGTQMTGAASDGQIYHYSGTTTINNVIATGVTENCPKSVWYPNEGTLTINGGTFDKIVVDSDNYGGVKSVAELLGAGCTYKKQDGTWATADELAAMEISNVTVKKIPLTINPQGDTSWYYGSPHTLAMNAAPADGGTVTYAWKNGENPLDCITDACTVPADTPVGSDTYTCEATCDGYTLSHTFSFEIKKSGTQFVGDGTVKTYKDGAECSDFTADDTITVKATPTATGKAPAKAAARLKGELTNGQMAVFVGDNQVSGAVNADADGSYTMEIKAGDVLRIGNVEPNGGPVTLTAKFIGNDNMADGEGTVTVNITAAAKIENGSTTTYVGESGLDAAFKDKGNSSATFTLLKDVERTEYLSIDINCILDLGGHTITCTDGTAIGTLGNKNVTIQGAGEVVSASGTALDVGGNVTLKGGTFTGVGSQYAGVNVNDESGSLSVTENVTIQNTGGGYGLAVSNAQSVQLSGGKYSGTAGAIVIVSQSSSLTLGGLLAHSGDTRYAYFDESGTTPFTGVLSNKSLTGTVTVKECNHTGDGVCEYTHAKGTTTHQQTCLACGKVETEENCSYTDGKCACGSTLSVALTNTEKLVYNGKSHEPGVTVTLDGTKLTAAGYDVTYADNVDAGTDTATVTVTGKGNYSFEIEKTFSIEKAEQKDFAVVEKTTQYEKNGTLTLSTTGGGGDGAVLYRVPENNGVLMVNGDQATIIGVGTVTVTATKAESGNYKAATATGIIIITKAPAPAITYPTAADSITYGQKLSDCALTGGSTEYGTFAWENGSMIPTVDNTGYTVVFTASKETEKNYETITDTTQNVPVKVKQAVPAVSVTAAVSGSKDNRQAVITVNVAKAGAGAFPTGTVTFIDCTGSTEVTIGTATLSNGSASYTWDGLQDKTYTIKAVYKGNNNYTEAESRETAFDAAKQNQQDFALDAIGAKTYGDAAITLKTTGGSGSGAVRYESSDENVIRIEDGRAVIVGAGTATITAIKEGDNNYNEASASRNVTVAKKALTVRADSKTVVRGNPMPAFTYRTDGLVNGDTFTKAPAITAGAQDTDTLGKYDIVINGGTLRNSESYSITYVNGTLNIVERFYTVTVTDGTGGGEYAQGDTVTVTANEKNGYTFTGWSSGDGVAFADSKAKTTTFTMPTKSVTVKANYTRNSSGGNNGGGSGDGGNSGGSGNNSGGNSGDNRNNGGGGSTNPGNGSTTPQIPVIPPAENINPGNEATPGTGTTPVNPGNGNTSRPGTTPGSGTGTPAQGTKQPFIKGGDGRTGWDVIRAEEEQAQEGSTINVDMNGSVVVPGDIFDSIKGKDITITFDMGNGIIWSVDGKSITADKAGDIDFSVKTGVKTVPVDIVNNVTGENYSIQISLAHEGEFGFTAVLSIGLGRENAGYTASLYYYNENTGELEFICKDQIAEDGTVSLVFTHASDYVIAVDIESMDGKEGVDNTPETSRTGDDSIIADVKENDEVAWIYKLVIIAVGTIVIVAGFGIIFIWKKKKEEQ